MLKNRIARAKSLLASANVDAIYVTSRYNHRYFTGYDNEDGSVLITRENAYVFADFRYIEVAHRDLDGIFEVIMPETPRADYLGQLLRRDGVARLGYEDHQLSCFAKEALENDLPEGCTLAPFGRRLEELREIKDAYEIEQMERAQKLTDDAFAHILTVLTPEMTETEVALELEYYMRRHGAEDKSFDTICVSGPSSSLPHGIPGNVKLRPGFLTMDFGALVNGYHSDMTRTVCIGRATPEMKALYQTVLDAQLRSLEAITAGANNRAIDGIARALIEGDYPGCFGHGLGHGVGLEIHESPRLSYVAPPTLTLRPGNVVTVEPGIYLAGQYGCRIEDMVLVTENGYKNFTKSPKELIEL
ncbi:MAG: aminopeptidase P family protein [Clostridia bacterium]|nr:aminopeptidase P family protein [Clostridia bacterium]